MVSFFYFLFTCPTLLDSETDILTRLSCPAREQIIWTVASNPRFWQKLYVCVHPAVMTYEMSWILYMWSWTAYTSISSARGGSLPVIGTKCIEWLTMRQESHQAQEHGFDICSFVPTRVTKHRLAFLCACAYSLSHISADQTPFRWH